MAQRAFIVKIDISDGSNLQAIVDDITESVSGDGYTVISVAPWTAPTEIPAMQQSILGPSPTSDMNMSLPGLDSLKL